MDMKDTSVKLIKKLEVATLDGDKVMVDFQTGKYFWLKGIANDIWERLGTLQKVEIPKLISQLRTEYEVDATVCEQEVRKFIDQLVEIKFAKYC